MKNNSNDVIVLGLGAMGSATLYQLARRGVRVLGIDRYSPPHILGSTHGQTRITRQAIGEGMAYTPLALRSHQIWRELEAQSGAELLVETGGLILSSANGPGALHGRSDFLSATIACAQNFGIAHEVLSTEQIHLRYPSLRLRGKEQGYFEPGAGYLRPEQCVATQIALAQQMGATVHTNEAVLNFTSDSSGVQVKTERRTYAADRLVITAGPWLGELLGTRYADLFKVYRQVMYWFEVEPDADKSFAPQQFPIFIWDFGTGLPVDDIKVSGGIYGFPAIDGPQGGLKIATEQYEVPTTPENMSRTVEAEEIERMFTTNVQPFFWGITSKCLRTVVCPYTVTPDSNFVLDFHPQYSNVLIASPCSGHGFKHSAAIGEALARLTLDGKSDFDLTPFSFKRFVAGC